MAASPGPRRRAIVAGGLGSVGALGLAASVRADRAPSARQSAPSELTEAQPVVPALGPRQAGITTTPQTHAMWVGADVRGTRVTRSDAIRLLRVWTEDIVRLTSGRGGLTDQAPELAAGPHRLTITVALGPGFFASADLAPLRPSWLKHLPSFEIDRLDDRWKGGDVVLQLCSDSAVTIAHAHRQLMTGARSLLEPRWIQRGYREPANPPTWSAGRNLFGQVDGTVQPALDGTDDDLLWVGDGSWRDGSALVLRRIAMNLDTWDALDRDSREVAIGRRLDSGAPLTGTHEQDPPDLAATDETGLPVIDQAAHMRRAMPRARHERFLRRPYTYDDEPGPRAVSNQGLLFAAYCADPLRQFVPVQRRLAELDLLNIWTTPIGSTVAAILPGAREGEYLGQRVLEA